ncbi:MAG: ABC transporter permease [Muribaculum sp.]|nr:ABC transporter permease [Muribaculum sp.]
MKLHIFDTDNWREIMATLGRNRTRTFLTAFGIFWGTAMLALLYGGSQGLQDLLARKFQGISTNCAGFWAQQTTLPYKGYKKGRTWEITVDDIASVRSAIPQIKASTCINTIKSTARYKDRTYSSAVQGIDEDYNKISGPGLVEGRHLNESDIRDCRKVAVIGKHIATELFGNTSPIGNFIEVDNIYYNVVGVYTQINEMRINGEIDECISIPSSTMNRTYNFGNRIDFFLFEPVDGITPSQLMPRIRRILYNRHTIHPQDETAVQAFDLSERFATIYGLFGAVDFLALFVGIGTLLAGVIGVGNIMWIIVKERTQEIGIRRAIGARPIDVIMQILTESMTLTVIAGMSGIVFAVVILSGAAKATAGADGDIAGFQLSFANAIIVLSSFIILGTAAGTIPALKAMHIRPIEALNDK